MQLRAWSFGKMFVYPPKRSWQPVSMVGRPVKWWGNATVSVVATAVLLISAAGCGRAGSGPRTMKFNGKFSPVAMQALDGQLWLIGTTPHGCGAERINPSDLHTKLFPLPSCEAYLAAGGHHLYVLGIDESAGSPAAEEHVVTFDPATGGSVVAPATVARTFGSGVGHMAFSYGLGGLWLYTLEDGALARISTASGTVQSTVTSLESGGGHPVMAFTDHAVWFAEGPGGPRLYRLADGATKAKVVYTAPNPGSVLWAAAVGNRVWASVATYSNGGQSVHTRLVAFDDSGKRDLTSGVISVGEAAVAGPDGALWSVGRGASCNNPQKLWRSDDHAKTKAVEILKSPAQGCLFETQIQSAGRYVFVLDGTGSNSPAGVLYRFTAS
jgi:hypothetical protein